MTSAPAVVVVIAPPDDLHALTVPWEVGRLGGRALILDLAQFPADWQLSVSATSSSPFDFVLETGGERFGRDDIAGIWWRRSASFAIPQEVEDATLRRFCRNECQALIDGWLHAMGQRVVNPLRAEFAAQRKPFQLVEAAACGLTIADTLISNSPELVEDFAARAAHVPIYKPLTAIAGAPMVFTRRLTPAVRARLDHLRTAPVIVQDAITGGADLRVTIVGDTVFPARLAAAHADAEVDWRRDPTYRTLPYDLPDGVATRLRALQRRLGLHYGAYDLRTDADGQHHFLEVNCAGQYLWVEIATGQPISATLAALLLHGGEAVSER